MGFVIFTKHRYKLRIGGMMVVCFIGSMCFSLQMMQFETVIKYYVSKYGSEMNCVSSSCKVRLDEVPPLLAS